MDALSAQGNLSEARPASPAYILRATTNSVAPGVSNRLFLRRRHQSADQVKRGLLNRRGWVNSYEQTWVNFRERQGM